MIARIAILLVFVGGGIGTILRVFYMYPEVEAFGMFVLTLVVLGGAVGTLVRFFINGIFMPISGSTDFPVGTLVANIVGTFLYAAIYVCMVKNYFYGALGNYMYFAVTMGLAGGISTFSAFTVDIVTLINKRLYSKLIAYMLANVLTTMLIVYLIFESFNIKGDVSSDNMKIVEVNIIGCALMGILGGIMVRFSDGGYGGTAGFIFFGTGILGAFTTFSHFAIETAFLIQRGAQQEAIEFFLYCFGGSILAFSVCFYITRALLTLRRNAH